MGDWLMRHVWFLNTCSNPPNTLIKTDDARHQLSCLYTHTQSLCETETAGVTCMRRSARKREMKYGKQPMFVFFLQTHTLISLYYSLKLTTSLPKVPVRFIKQRQFYYHGDLSSRLHGDGHFLMETMRQRCLQEDATDWERKRERLFSAARKFRFRPEWRNEEIKASSLWENLTEMRLTIRPPRERVHPAFNTNSELTLFYVLLCAIH